MSLFDVGIPYQDYIILGGLPSPGVAVVRPCNSPRNWDIRKGYGFSGSYLVFTGVGLSKFSVDIYAWKAEHFAAWKIFAKALLIPPKITDVFAPLKNASLSIKHPVLNDDPHNIDQVVVEDVTSWDQTSPGMWVRTINFIQFKAPVHVLMKPFEGPPGSPVKVNPPVDPELVLIKAQSAQIEVLSK